MTTNTSRSKVLKITLSVFALAVLFFITAIILLTTLVNPNNFKHQISTIIKQKTGREFVIAGDMKWSFFPWLGMRANQIAVGNAPGFGQQAFAHIGEADVSIRALPLFTGKVEIGTITLKDVVVNLTKNKQGQTNWSDLTRSKNTAKQKPQLSSNQGFIQEVNAATKYNADAKIPDVSISNLEVKNATINWQNQQTGQTVAIQHLNFNTHNVASGKTFPMKLDFDLQSNKPAVNAYVDFSSKINFNRDTQQYALHDIDLSGNLQNKAYTKDKIPFMLKGNIESDLTVQTLEASNINAKFDTFTAQVDLKGTNILQTPAFQGSVNIPGFNLRQLLTDLGQKVQTQDPQALQNVAFKAQTQFSPKFIKLSQIKANLDDTTLTGRFNFANFSSKNFDFDLNVDQIDVSRYMSSASADTKVSANANSNSFQANAAPAAEKPAATPLPVNLLRQLNGEGTLKIGKLTAAKITTTDVYMLLAANRGLIKLSPITANIYQGQSTGSIVLDARSATPALAMNESLSNVQVGEILNDVTKTSKIQLTGTGNLNLNVHTQGKTSEAMIQALNGNIRFAINNGTIKNLDIGQQIAAAISHVLGTNTSANSSGNDTNFSSLTGTAQIINGVATNNDLLLKSPALQATGSGKADLVNQTIDYNIKATALDNTFGRDIITLQQKIGGSIPIRITGSLSDPKIQPDYAALAQGVLKGQVSDNLEQQIEKHIGKDIKVNDAIKAIQGILGN